MPLPDAGVPALFTLLVPLPGLVVLVPVGLVLLSKALLLEFPFVEPLALLIAPSVLVVLVVFEFDLVVFVAFLLFFEVTVVAALFCFFVVVLSLDEMEFGVPSASLMELSFWVEVVVVLFPVWADRLVLLFVCADATLTARNIASIRNVFFMVIVV